MNIPSCVSRAPFVSVVFPLARVYMTFFDSYSVWIFCGVVFSPVYFCTFFPATAVGLYLDRSLFRQQIPPLFSFLGASGLTFFYHVFSLSRLWHIFLCSRRGLVFLSFFLMGFLGSVFCCAFFSLRLGLGVFLQRFAMLGCLFGDINSFFFIFPYLFTISLLSGTGLELCACFACLLDY
jgi:hypothetical protein